MRFLFLVLTCLFSFQMLHAQVVFPGTPENPDEAYPGNEPDSLFILDELNVNQDSRLENILKWHIENNKKRDGISGFRVEIFFSSSLMQRIRHLTRKRNFCRDMVIITSM
jgi:hypothetical protein